MKLIGGQLQASRIQVKGRYLKGPFLEPAIENSKSTFFKNQELQMRAGFIDENKSIPIDHFAVELI